MKRHYHIYANVAGYMPDCDSVHQASDLRTAGRVALDIAREYREHGYAVFGNQRGGYRAERRPYSPTALDTYIHIAPCCDDCEGDEQ
jgi:hypothetical protein